MRRGNVVIERQTWWISLGLPFSMRLCGLLDQACQLYLCFMTRLS